MEWPSSNSSLEPLTGPESRSRHRRPMSAPTWIARPHHHEPSHSAMSAPTWIARPHHHEPSHSAMSARAKSPAAATRPAPKARSGDPDPPERERAVETEIRERRNESGPAPDGARGKAATAAARPPQQRDTVAAVDDAERATQRRCRGDASHDERRETEAGQVTVFIAGTADDRRDDVLDAALIGKVHGGCHQCAPDASTALLRRDEQVADVQGGHR